jgi:hypothetical protein
MNPDDWPLERGHIRARARALRLLMAIIDPAAPAGAAGRVLSELVAPTDDSIDMLLILTEMVAQAMSPHRDRWTAHLSDLTADLLDMIDAAPDAASLDAFFGEMGVVDEAALLDDEVPEP